MASPMLLYHWLKKNKMASPMLLYQWLKKNKMASPMLLYHWLKKNKMASPMLYWKFIGDAYLIFTVYSSLLVLALSNELLILSFNL